MLNCTFLDIFCNKFAFLWVLTFVCSSSFSFLSFSSFSLFNFSFSSFFLFKFCSSLSLLSFCLYSSSSSAIEASHTASSCSSSSTYALLSSQNAHKGKCLVICQCFYLIVIYSHFVSKLFDHCICWESLSPPIYSIQCGQFELVKYSSAFLLQGNSTVFGARTGRGNKLQDAKKQTNSKCLMLSTFSISFLYYMNTFVCFFHILFWFTTIQKGFHGHKWFTSLKLFLQKGNRNVVLPKPFVYCCSYVGRSSLIRLFWRKRLPHLPTTSTNKLSLAWEGLHSKLQRHIIKNPKHIGHFSFNGL